MKELRKQLRKNPNVHIISGKEKKTFQSLLKKKIRTEEEWEVIKDILTNCDVITIEPRVESKTFSRVGHILSFNGDLRVFTDPKICEDYLDAITALYSAQDYGGSFLIGILPFEYVASLAEEKEMVVCIDDPLYFKRTFLTLDGKKHLLKASMRLLDSEDEKKMKSLIRMRKKSLR